MPRRRPRTLLLNLLAAAVVLSLWHPEQPPAAEAGPPERRVGGGHCRTSTAEPEHLWGTLRVRPGRTARRVHPAGTFRDGSVAARFVVPAHGGRLTLAVGIRRFRAAVVHRTGERPRLELHWRNHVLASRPLSFRAGAGRKVHVRLAVARGSVRAKAWRHGRHQPRWLLRTSHRAADRGAGRASVRAALRGGERVRVRFSRGTVRVARRHSSVGVYDGMFSHDVTRRLFGSYPAVATSYYQPDQTVNARAERARIRRGISPNITITTKGTRLIEALGTGRRHPFFPRAKAWLDRYVAGLARIAGLDPDVPVYATIEHEFKVKVRTRAVTGLSASPVMYGRTLRRFYARARALDPNIRVTYWMVADDGDRALEYTVGHQLTVPPDAILFDPYGWSTSSTVASITAGDLAWIKSQRWYVGQEIALGEFGMPVRLGDSALASFYAGVHSDLRARGLAWGVLFNRTRDFDTQIAGRRDGRSFPRGVAAFRAALATSTGC